MQEKRVLSLRVVMDEELENKFSQIKKELGLTSNAEVVRFLVNRFYKELVNKGGLIALALAKTLDSTALSQILDTEVTNVLDLLIALPAI